MRRAYSVPSGSQEWLDLRQNYITATEMSCLLGVNPYQTAAKMLREKEQPSEFLSNVHTRRGKILEPAVMELCKVDYGMDVQRWAAEGTEEVLVDEDLGISCTPDGRYFNGTQNVPVECKTVLQSTYVNKWLDKDTFPVHYMVQLYMQIWLSDASEGYLVGMAVSNELHHVVLKMQRSTEFELLVIETLQKLEKVRANKKKFTSSKKVASKVGELLREVTTMMWCDVSKEVKSGGHVDWDDIEW
jgi:putative phage-type endonuclease